MKQVYALGTYLGMLGLVMMTAIGLVRTVYGASADERVICHATGSTTSPYFRISVDYATVLGKQQWDTHLQNDPDDLFFYSKLAECPDELVPSPTPTPTETIMPTPTETIMPTPTPTQSPGPTPTLDPSVGPTPTIQPGKPTHTPGVTTSPTQQRETSMDANGPTCEERNFVARLIVSENGKRMEQVQVTFTYRGQQLKALTNTDGVASVTFAYAGSGVVYGEADGYPTGQVEIVELVCGGVGGGVSSEGEVLGASTLAATSDVSSWLVIEAVLWLAGVGLGLRYLMA